MECSYFILNTMKLLSKLSLPFIFFTAILTLECAAQDWPNLNRYREANKAIMEMRKNDSEDDRKNWVDMIMDNIKSMTELAQANHIKVVLCSVLPANRYGWSPEVQPADTIIALNELIKDYARSKRLIYVDFYTALVDEQKGLNPNYGRDSVHPNLDGYKVMEPLVVKGIKRALSRP